MAATSTRIAAVSPGVTAPVTSTVPQGQAIRPHSVPLTYTTASVQTRSKRRVMVRPRHSAGIGVSRAYQARATREPSYAAHCGPSPGATTPRRSPAATCQSPGTWIRPHADSGASPAAAGRKRQTPSRDNRDRLSSGVNAWGVADRSAISNTPGAEAVRLDRAGGWARRIGAHGDRTRSRVRMPHARARWLAHPGRFAVTRAGTWRKRAPGLAARRGRRCRRGGRHGSMVPYRLLRRDGARVTCRRARGVPAAGRRRGAVSGAPRYLVKTRSPMSSVTPCLVTASKSAPIGGPKRLDDLGEDPLMEVARHRLLLVGETVPPMRRRYPSAMVVSRSCAKGMRTSSGSPNTLAYSASPSTFQRVACRTPARGPVPSTARGTHARDR